MRIVMLIAALLIGGCVTTESIIAPLRAMKGQSIQVAVAKLGYPAEKREMLGDSIYVWSTNRQALLIMPTTTLGAVGRVGYSQTSYGATPAQLYCTIQIATDAADVIKRVQFEGNQGGCRMYARELSAK
jgi:hypothetical protein